MVEIEGTVRGFRPPPEELTNKPWVLVWRFSVEFGEAPSFKRRNIEIQSPHATGALWDGFRIKVEDNGDNPIQAYSAHIITPVNSTLMLDVANWRHGEKDSFEGEVRHFLERHESANLVNSSNTSIYWRNVWDLLLTDGTRSALVEFRSGRPWNGSISEGDRVLAQGRRSDQNILLASRLEDKKNGLVVERKSWWAFWD
jgi:hypothetical protein